MIAQELRIGNLIHYNETQLRVACNTIEDLIRDNISGRTDRFTPIPLSSEWLERFGFEKYKDVEGETLRRHGKILLNKRFAVRYSDTNDDWYYSTAIVVHHVHQLQNLYFALTGSELELQPQTQTQ